MRMKHLTWAAGLLLMVGATSTSALAQGVEGTDRAIRVALIAVVQDLKADQTIDSSASLAITPHYIMPPSGRDVPRGPAVREEMIRALARLLGADVRPLQSVKSCQERNPGSCRLHDGLGVVLSFTEPYEVDGSTVVFVRAVYADPTSRRQPVATEVKRVRLTRTDTGEWSVSEMMTVLIT